MNADMERELRIKLWGAWLKGWRETSSQEPPAPAMQDCKIAIDALINQYKSLFEAAHANGVNAANEATEIGRLAAQEWTV